MSHLDSEKWQRYASKLPQHRLGVYQRAGRRRDYTYADEVRAETGLGDSDARDLLRWLARQDDVEVSPSSALVDAYRQVRNELDDDFDSFLGAAWRGDLGRWATRRGVSDDHLHQLAARCFIEAMRERGVPSRCARSRWQPVWEEWDAELQPELSSSPRVEVEEPDPPKSASKADVLELVQARVEAAKRKKASRSVHEREVVLPAEPVGFLVMGDPHLDNPGCDWDSLVRHVELAKATPGVMAATVGDVHDNWIGRLGRLYHKATVTAQQGWELSEWLFDELDWFAVVGGNHDCHDEQTEVLTRRGWLAFPDVRDDDKVLGLTPDGCSEWQGISRRVDYDYDGPLFGIETAQVSALVTPNHRILHRRRLKSRTGTSWGDLEYATPPGLKGRIGLPVSGSGPRRGVDLTDDQIRLAGWVLTDGTIERRRGEVARVGVSQRASNAHVVEAALDACGVTYARSERDRGITKIAGVVLKSRPEPEVTFRVPAAASRDLLSTLGFDTTAVMPEWALDLTDSQWTVMLAAMMDADGAWASSGRAGALYGSRAFLESVQAVCVGHGWSASLSEYRTGHWRLNVCRRELAQMDWKPSTAHYTGKVYCLTVPLGNFCVRRNGKAHYSGNSWAHGPGIDPMRWLTDKCGVRLYAPDELRITVRWRDSTVEPFIWLLRHDVRGRSWFHATHGPHKEAMLDGRVHLVTVGHTHEWAYLTTEHRHGRVTHAARVRGYKRDDCYAREKGFTEQEHGEACLVVVDPTRPEPGRVRVWWDIEAGCDWLRARRAKVARA